jgi:hypothetical protein
MGEEAAIHHSESEMTTAGSTGKENKMKVDDRQINYQISPKMRLPAHATKIRRPSRPSPGKPGCRIAGAQRGLAARNQNDMGRFPRPLGEGWTATGVFTIPQSGSGPGEGVIKNLAEKTRNYGLAAQGTERQRRGKKYQRHSVSY